MTNKMFGNMTADNLEQAEDRLGGFQPLNTDAYDGTVKALYAGASESGAQNLTLIADLGGREYRETIYFTNRSGENFYTTKNNKKAPLPGFTLVDHICLVTTGAPLCEQETEEKTVKVYDAEARAEVPKQVQMLTAALGQPITLAILRILENKSQKNSDGKYEDIAETREVNQIDKVFDTESRMTVVEAENQAEEATFYSAWVEKNRGETRDRRTIRDGEAGQSGNPAAGAGSNTGAGGRPSLFNKKS